MTTTFTFDKDGNQIGTIVKPEADPYNVFLTDSQVHSQRIEFDAETTMSFYRVDFRVNQAGQ